MRLRFLGAPPVVAAAILTVFSAEGWAQSKCQELRGLMPWRLGFYNASIFTWIGPTYISLGGDEVLISDFVLPPGPPPEQRSQGVVGMDRGARFMWDFGSNDTVTGELHSVAVYPTPPGKAGFGYYRATWRFTGGTGRFAQATGNVIENGPYLVWFEKPSDPVPQGLYLGELSGTICGVLPK